MSLLVRRESLNLAEYKVFIKLTLNYYFFLFVFTRISSRPPPSDRNFKTVHIFCMVLFAFFCTFFCWHIFFLTLTFIYFRVTPRAHVNRYRYHFYLFHRFIHSLIVQCNLHQKNPRDDTFYLYTLYCTIYLF